MLVGMHAPMPVMVVMFEDFMEKHAKPVLLGVVKTVIKGLRCIRDLFQFRTARLEALGP